MPLPKITHLQFLVLTVLMDGGEVTGQALRDGLARAGERKSGPGFYQFMARLEDGGFVEGWYDQKVIDGQVIKERCYRITGEGERAVDEARAFYARAMRGWLTRGTA
jgi:DNA-binding PadR family transcriptional regulator